MHASKSAKAFAGNANALEIGHFDLPSIADDNVFDVAFAIDKRTYLPARFMGQLAELPSKFWCDDLVGRNPTLIELLNSPQLVWFETLCVTVKTSHSP